MKKVLITLLIFGTVLVLGQGVHYGENVLNNANSATWDIRVSADDTSLIYETRGIMTFWVWGYDDSGNDSVDIDFTFQVCPDTNLQSGAWTTEHTYTLDSDSTWERWNITDQPIGAGLHWRMIATGGSANVKLDTCFFLVVFKGYQSSRR